MTLRISLALTVAVHLCACGDDEVASSDASVPRRDSAAPGDGGATDSSTADDSSTPPADGGPMADGGTPVDLSWVVGDPHIHSRGCGAPATEPAEFVPMLAAEDLQFGNALVWGQGYATDVGYFTGDDDPASTSEVILHYDLEVSVFPAGDMGHLTLLGLDRIDFSPTPFMSPSSGVPVLEWARAENPNAIVGVNHIQFWPEFGLPGPAMRGCCMPFELVVHVARDRVSFVEFEQITAGGLRLWTALLNSGFRLALAGASDFPCLNFTVGALRTRVQIDGPLRFDAIVDGIRRGRTVLTTPDDIGLDMTVDGAPLGSDVAIVSGETVAVEVTASLPRAGDLFLQANGQVVATQSFAAGPVTWTTMLPLDESSWLSARRDTRDLTSPTYVIVDGNPIRASADDACYLIRYVDQLIGFAMSGGFDLGADGMMAISAYTEARTELMTRFTEAGGTACP
jgi:hypothetical protein